MAQEIVPVWKRITPELQAELARYWLENEIMRDEGKATQRAAQVVCLVRDGGRILGVTTAYPQVSRMLRQPMLYLRMHLLPELRNQALSHDLLNASFDALEEQQLAREKPACLGVMLSIRNPRLANHYNAAYWPATKFAYAGTRDDQVLRVRYFEGVRLPPPVTLKPRARPATA
jgi:hypothetical protein